jgi:hypothetical protein
MLKHLSFFHTSSFALRYFFSCKWQGHSVTHPLFILSFASLHIHECDLQRHKCKVPRIYATVTSNGVCQYYLTLRSVLSLNNPQNSEMKFCEKYEVDMLKIIIIIIGYTLNNNSLFTSQYYSRWWKLLLLLKIKKWTTYVNGPKGTTPHLLLCFESANS